MEEITPEYWRDRLATNLDHCFFCIQGVAPAMAAAGGGSIVNLGSCVWRLGAHLPVRKKLHAKEGPWAVQRRSGVVATSDFAGRRRDANSSRRSS
jgi:NAD(P)-dependent dehydrogenase (short-subunit alcohol dehydrogenase family)